MSLRLVMMGTGRFALPTFLALYESTHVVAGLITQPDRTGRGHHRHHNPLKEAAQEHGTPVLQPARVNAPASLLDLHRLDADLFVVAAYGQILSDELLQIPRLGAINVHASLLPKYRGAAPVQYAIKNGDSVSGVSVLMIEPKLDAGPVLGVQETPIAPKESAGELEQRLAHIAPPLTVRVIDSLEAGTITAVVQNASEVSLAPRLKKSDGAIDWAKPAADIACHVRAMQPWPKAFTYLHHADKVPLRLILLDVDSHLGSAGGLSGQVVRSDDKQLLVQSGDGVLEILQLQPDGKRSMSAAEFVRGRKLVSGDWLGSESCGD